MADADTIRSKFKRFRILVIGRANAGKTTILQKVCGTTDHPEIYDSKGNKIDVAVLQPSRERGYHNIENEMVFDANPGFIFHDSRGFEAGGVDEFDSMKEFISKREKSTEFNERIHVIWYCLSLDEISRPISRAEEKFFKECDPGSIPVILVLTKVDAVRAIALGQVDKSLGSKRREAAMQLVPSIVDGANIWGRLCKMQYPPRAEVRLQDLHKGGDCSILLEHTSNALDDIVLKQLFVSTQQIHIELCIANATRHALLSSIRTILSVRDEKPVLHELQMEAALWFPITKEVCLCVFSLAKMILIIRYLCLR
ncbi:hypothetical protein BJ138DRAFT_1094125 [Hygrophoropsis aurantiaca]|uniref:Uncharacterized protein n=1 Tax=Hygrophoropsis aurantiaca TaxID=72124 RepID=A0ACB8A0F7_9AGAM|nr:hypothetical protein BJ138DRAFT_1094125 [Hygrophoropsis aurantiaca]